MKLERSTELERAQRRADYPHLLQIADVYHRYSEGGSTYEFYEGNSKTIDEVMDAPVRDPDKALALIAIFASTYHGPEFLGLVAAGVIEDLLRPPTPEILDRVLVEARRSARFRWMLSGVWFNDDTRWVEEKLAPLVADYSLEDALPPP